METKLIRLDTPDYTTHLLCTLIHNWRENRNLLDVGEAYATIGKLAVYISDVYENVSAIAPHSWEEFEDLEYRAILVEVHAYILANWKDLDHGGSIEVRIQEKYIIDNTSIKPAV